MWTWHQHVLQQCYCCSGWQPCCSWGKASPSGSGHYWTLLSVARLVRGPSLRLSPQQAWVSVYPACGYGCGFQFQPLYTKQRSGSLAGKMEHFWPGEQCVWREEHKNRVLVAEVKIRSGNQKIGWQTTIRSRSHYNYSFVHTQKYTWAQASAPLDSDSGCCWLQAVEPSSKTCSLLHLHPESSEVLDSDTKREGFLDSMTKSRGLDFQTFLWGVYLGRSSLPSLGLPCTSWAHSDSSMFRSWADWGQVTEIWQYGVYIGRGRPGFHRPARSALMRTRRSTCFWC